jgi:hypothetical protein
VHKRQRSRSRCRVSSAWRPLFTHTQAGACIPHDTHKPIRMAKNTSRRTRHRCTPSSSSVSGRSKPCASHRPVGGLSFKFRLCTDLALT